MRLFKEDNQTMYDLNSETDSQKIAVMITSDVIGHGDDELGFKTHGKFYQNTFGNGGRSLETHFN